MSPIIARESDFALAQQCIGATSTQIISLITKMSFDRTLDDVNFDLLKRFLAQRLKEEGYLEH